MATDKELKLAKEAFALLCKTFDDKGMKYDKEEDKLFAHIGVSGEDIPMDFFVQCDAERQLVKVISFLPFKMCEEKRIEGAIATSYVNYQIADGSFDYNFADGKIAFRMTSSFRESLIGAELFDYMVGCSIFTVDRYNDQFLMLNKGMLSIEDFIKNN